ncbi:fatty acid desaturase family protein [Blastococcus sp. TF02-8]|uniref:fatty acid desaturase family protein n=1 Tax=Blastococcus sp. TF02-8 TaxID=2250574 RepID=UPI001411C8D3|nr:fatty acid desaturase family protein [Blastococcus sp. TF02-8]
MKKEIRGLHQARNNWRSLLTLAFDWSVIGAAGVTAARSGYRPRVYLPAVLVIGSRQRALRSLIHEASHYKLLRNRRANTWVGRLGAGFPLLEGTSAYTCSHCEHHRHLWDQEQDPKRRQYANLGIIRPRDPVAFRRRHLLEPLLLKHVPYNVLSALYWRDEERVETVARLAFLAAATTVVVHRSWTRAATLLWLVPYCTTYQVFRYWSDIADHAGLETDDAWQATRSWDASWLTKALLSPHNANLHLPHHLFPALPHYRAKAADRLLSQVPQYRAGHHCDGFVRPRRPDRPSVVQDVLQPEDIGRFHSGELVNAIGRVRQAASRLGRGASPAPGCSAGPCGLERRLDHARQ